MKRRVVITGIGLVGPNAMNTNEFWSNLENGKSSIEKITKCDVSKLDVKYGGQIKYQFPENKFNSRFIHKCDDFSIYSLHTVAEALEDAKLNIKEVDNYRIGIYVGNSSGGWHGAELGLNDLHSKGVEAVNPYLASNWFPAAPQGHLSIYYGIKGYSKTVIGDMAGSNIAIGNAFNIIQNDKADFMIAGGSENLMVAWALIFYQTNKILSFIESDPDIVYQPFGKKRSGLILSEGAAYVILESLESARARNANIYCELVGYGLTNDGYDYLAGDPSGEQYARCIRLATKNNIPDLVFLNGAAHQREDDSEINGVNIAFKESLDKVKFACPKTFFGHSYGAASSMDVVTACLSMKYNKIIKTGNLTDLADNVNFNIITGKNINSTVNNALIMAKGLGGINSGLFLNKDID
jgi:3-oxoacyl-(acyl-carrier-protein) synthase